MIKVSNSDLPEIQLEKALTSPSSLIGIALDSRYRITELVGAGTTSCLYKGFDRFSNVSVIVKILHRHLTSSRKSLLLFAQEAEAAKTVTYPGVVGVIDENIAPTGQPYIVWECSK